MSYILYSLTFLVLVLATALYVSRSRWLPLLAIPQYIYHRLPSSFSSDIESGFTSTNFDLTANVVLGDSRAGLDQLGKREVQKIMKSKKIGFDEARMIFTEQRFAQNGIRSDGRPEDPKFVSFS